VHWDNLIYLLIPLGLFLPILTLGYREMQEVRRSPEWREQRVVQWAKSDLPPLPRQVDWVKFEKQVRLWLLSQGDPFVPLDIDHALSGPLYYTVWRKGKPRGR